MNETGPGPGGEAPREEDSVLGGRDGMCKGPGCVDTAYSGGRRVASVSGSEI